MDNFDLKKYLAEGKLNESSLDGFEEMKKNQKMLNDAAEYFRDKAEKLKVKRDVIGDFTKGINDLIDSVFKADYKEGEYGIDDYIDQDVDPKEIASITGANLKDILQQIKDAKDES